MPVTPSGFAHCTTELRHLGVGRAAMVTYGIGLGIRPFDTNAANLIQQQFTAAFRPKMDTSVQMGPTVMHGGTSADPLVAESDGSHNVDGLNAIQSLPPQVAVLAKKLTGQGGRRRRGRVYLPWCIDAAAIGEGGTIVSFSQEEIQSAFTAWFENLGGADLQMVILHVEGKTPIPPPTDVVGLSVDPKVATQRRRLER